MDEWMRRCKEDVESEERGERHGSDETGDN